MYETILKQYASDPDRLLSRHEAADLLGVQPCTLAAWASLRKAGLPYVRVGGRAKYRRADVEAFIERNLIGVES